jgi:choline dehydrogenase
LPYFQRSEDQDDYTNPTAGRGGAMAVSNAGKHNPNPTSAAFIEACKALGYPETADFNGPNMEGVGWHHINVRDGKRHSTAEGYLIPALGRPNLTVSESSHATKLLFSGKRCTGVEYLKDGRHHKAHAKQEVIVCAGAIESPKLLMLSGIGDPAQLKEHGIDSLAGIPGVGANFHNHVLTGVIYECTKPVPPGQQNLSESALFLKSDPGWVGPDLQIGFVHVPFNIIVGKGHPNSITVLPGVVRPLSRGWVRLASGNALDKPLVNPNYFGVRSDLERLVQAVKLSREIFATDPLSSWVGNELMPGPEFPGNDRLEAFVRQSSDSYHHQAGSCKMGLDDMAVVDPKLRVHGIDGLRVADASVMPQVTSGNCHAGIVMIAERLADWLKQEHGLQA